MFVAAMPDEFVVRLMELCVVLVLKLARLAPDVIFSVTAVL